MATDAISESVTRGGESAMPGEQQHAGQHLRPDDARSLPSAGSCFTVVAQQPSTAAGGGAEINRFAAKVSALTPRIMEWLRGDDRAIVTKEAAEFAAHGRRRSSRSSSQPVCISSACSTSSISLTFSIAIPGVADTYFALMDYLGTDGLLTAVSGLPRDDRWHALARLAIRDDVYGSLRALCFDVLTVGEPDETGEQKISSGNRSTVLASSGRGRTLAEIYADGERDLATLSVAARQIRSMTPTSGTPAKNG